MQFTGRLLRAAARLGLTLCDHVIVGDSVYFSMLDDEGVCSAAWQAARAAE